MNTKHRSAFTLIEVLLALVILGMLMTAVAIAFDASVKNYQANEGIYRTVNTGRQALLRITNDVRTAQAVSTLGVPSGDSPTQLTLLAADGNTLRYRLDTGSKTLYLDTVDDSASFALCRNVESMVFNRSTVVGSDPVAIRNVRIKMVLKDPVSEVTQTLVAAAVVRRNLDN